MECVTGVGVRGNVVAPAAAGQLYAAVKLHCCVEVPSKGRDSLIPAVQQPRR